MNKKLKNIIEKWFKCDMTGDEAMAQINKILHGDERNKNEINDACIKEKY